MDVDRVWVSKIVLTVIELLGKKKCESDIVVFVSLVRQIPIGELFEKKAIRWIGELQTANSQRIYGRTTHDRTFNHNVGDMSPERSRVTCHVALHAKGSR